MGFLLPLGCLQRLQPHSLQAQGLWDGMLGRPGTKPCPDAPGAATGLAGAQQGWIKPCSSISRLQSAPVGFYSSSLCDTSETAC